MANLTSITTTIGEAGSALNEFIGDNKATLIGVGAGLAGSALIVGTGLAVSRAKSSKKKKASSKSKRKRTVRARDRRFISRQKHEVAYQRRRKKLGKKTTGKYYKKHKKSKSKSKKGIHYTKNGQPYKILANGRARFIKK